LDEDLVTPGTTSAKAEGTASSSINPAAAAATAAAAVSSSGSSSSPSSGLEITYACQLRLICHSMVNLHFVI